MIAFTSLHKRKTLLAVILFIAFSAFTADILDLREELCIVSCPCSNLDNNVTTGMTSTVDFALESVVLLCTVHKKLSAEISFLHRLSYGLRAPPPWS
jgi:hypothetical protein